MSPSSCLQHATRSRTAGAAASAVVAGAVQLMSLHAARCFHPLHSKLVCPECGNERPKANQSNAKKQQRLADARAERPFYTGLGPKPQFVTAKAAHNHRNRVSAMVLSKEVGSCDILSTG